MKPQGTRRWQYLDQDTNFASPFCVLLFCDSASPFGEVFKPHLPDSPASFPQIPSLAESVSYHPTESTAPFKSLPVQEEMMTKYSNLSLESHNISVTAAPFTSLPVQEEMMTKSSNLSLESHSISMTAAPFISLPVQEEMMTKSSNLSLESHSISMTAMPIKENNKGNQICVDRGIMLQRNVTLVEHSNMPVEKNITLERPSNVELICQFTPSGDLNSVNVTWKKGDKLLEDNYLVNATGGTLYTQHRVAVINSKQMGSYSCFFGEKKQQRGTFNLKVPEINGQNKPLITYLGDSVVLMCKCQDCLPLNWTWYGGNGSVQVPIGVPVNDKYVISGKHANETRLKITQLSEDDQGTYLCHAIFELGESEGHVKLVVLSYLVPLKVFCAIAAEVVLLVAAILLFEMYTQKKKKPSDDGKEFEQGEQLKLDDSNGIENSGPRHRKNESVGQ
ncbi:embigin isoform X3 [Bos javanicus]|uniref:embigin isoform X3 n=1 Tax=Bos javanicus TaxID=9906 RepID=UPI002AA6F2B3|nr:embigin isoform X3 [Bos javanicus]